MHRVVICCKGYWMRIFFKWIYIYMYIYNWPHYWMLSNIMIEFSCSLHKGNKNAWYRFCIKWFEWEFAKIIKYTYIGLPIGRTIQNWWSQWVVMTIHHCYLWLGLWLDILWMIIVSYDYTHFHVNLKLLLWIFLIVFRDKVIPGSLKPLIGLAYISITWCHWTRCESHKSWFKTSWSGVVQ
jgi:hypothetical protein